MTLRSRNKKDGQNCALTVWLACLICAAAIFPASPALFARVRQEKSSPAASESLPIRVRSLVRQLYGVDLYASGPVTKQVQNLVIGSLTQWMAANGFESDNTNYPLDVRVRIELGKAFSKLHYPFYGTPVVFARPWENGELICAGYTLGWSQFERVNVLALYFSKDGKTRQVALTHFLPRADMHYAFLPPSATGAFRFLVYGNSLGKSQPRLSAILYSFDGTKLNNLWEQQNLYDGKIEVTPDQITTRYMIESEYVQSTQQGETPPWHQAVYKVTGSGISLLTEQLMPGTSTP